MLISRNTIVFCILLFVILSSLICFEFFNNTTNGVISQSAEPHPIMACGKEEIIEVGERITDSKGYDFSEIGFKYTQMHYPYSEYKINNYDIGIKLEAAHLFKSYIDNKYYLGFGLQKENDNDSYYYGLIVRFSKEDSKQIGITMVRYEIKTESDFIYFCYEQKLIKSLANIEILMKDGLDIEAKIATVNNIYQINSNVSKGTPYVSTFWYVIGTLAMFIQFVQVQGLSAVEIIQLRDNECSIKIKIVYFIAYIMVNTWYQMIGLFLATAFHYFEFLSVSNYLPSIFKYYNCIKDIKFK